MGSQIRLRGPNKNTTKQIGWSTNKPIMGNNHLMDCEILPTRLTVSNSNRSRDLSRNFTRDFVWGLPIHLTTTDNNWTRRPILRRQSDPNHSLPTTRRHTSSNNSDQDKNFSCNNESPVKGLIFPFPTIHLYLRSTCTGKNSRFINLRHTNIKKGCEQHHNGWPSS